MAHDDVLPDGPGGVLAEYGVDEGSYHGNSLRHGGGGGSKVIFINNTHDDKTSGIIRPDVV